MDKLPKETRLKVVEQAIELFEKNKGFSLLIERFNVGICFTLDYILDNKDIAKNDLPIAFLINDLVEMIPEFLEIKPEFAKLNSFWFIDKQQRIQALYKMKKLIEEAED